MNFWVEFWEKSNEQANRMPPNPEKVCKRLCQSREEADEYARWMEESGYHVIIKPDSGGGLL